MSPMLDFCRVARMIYDRKGSTRTKPCSLSQESLLKVDIVFEIVSRAIMHGMTKVENSLHP